MDEKGKVIEFKLSKTMNFAEMIKLGHQRIDVEALFIKLTELGYGEYIKGTVGKGNPSKFIGNEKMPETYKMFYKGRRAYNKKKDVTKEVIKEVSVEDNNNIQVETELKSVEDCISNTEKLEVLKKTPRAAGNLPTFYGVGYACTFTANYLVLDKVMGSGYPTIELAVQNVWDRIENRVTTFPSKIMDEKEQIASKLRGFGYLKLNDIIEEEEEL